MSVDLSYDLEYGNCRDTSTAQGQFAVTAPSAILITVASDRRSFNSYRPWPGSMGAPPLGQLSHEFEGTRVYCSGDEEDVSGPGDRHGELGGLAVRRRVPGLPLERTDPTIPWTSDGTARHPERGPGSADGTQIVITDTWSWKLTLEPDAGQ